MGEFGLIARILARLAPAASTLLGPGDDAAVVTAPDGRVVASTDLLVEGRHFRRDWSSGYDIGRRAAAQNLADIAAMGAVPTALLVGLACPPDLPVAWAEALADGLRDEALLVGAAVVGGDIVGSPVLTLAVTALGDLQGRPPVTRAGARVDDLVVVVGVLGRAAAGLAVLQAREPAGEGSGGRPGAAADTDPDEESLVGAFRRPQPPYGAGPGLADLGATAMIDTSDGLVQDLGHVAAASGVQVLLDTAALEELFAPALRAVRDRLAPGASFVLDGGEDHALVATVPPAARSAAEALGAHVVGRVGVGGGVRDLTGRELSGGWDHFPPQ